MAIPLGVFITNERKEFEMFKRQRTRIAIGLWMDDKALRAVMRNLWEQETMTARSIRQTEQVNSNMGKREKKEAVMAPRESHYR